MKKKILLMTAVAIIGFATITIAQPVPSYVPTSGLIGWWPFTGNANDESGNGNNGTVNGATLTSDRFGNTNKAYSFNGTSNFISVSNNNSLQTPNAISVNSWVQFSGQGSFRLISKGWSPNGIEVHTETSTNHKIRYGGAFNGTGYGPISQTTLADSQWYMVTTIDNGNVKYIYINGTLEDTLVHNYGSVPVSTINLYFGKNSQNATDYLDGKLDDIGIWNRALDSCEVKDLYFGSLGNCCNVSVTTQPINQSVNVSNNAQFTTSSSDPLATYQWQTDLGVGFQNLNSVGQYSGATNDTLTIANTTLSNNNQPFRCIISSGACTDTSNVAILTVNNNVGINEFTQDNLFSVYPNPVKSQINVKADAKLLGYVYNVYDNIGQVVLSGKINSENTVIELGNLSGGVYLFSVGENMKQTFKVIKE